jgi:UDP-glucose 4-epimerase
VRLLITGGAGFIGSNLAKLAVAEGVEVVVLDDLSTGDKSTMSGLDLSFVEGSVLDPEALMQALAGVDSVVHLAALPSVPRSIRDPLASHAANATGTLTVLERARSAGVTHLVAASSSSVYGSNPALPKGEREWVRPISPYGVSKLATEQYTLAYQQSFGFQTLAFRFFNVYGPGQGADQAYAAVIPVFIDALLDGRPLPVHGDGTQSRDFTYVGTVCRILCDSALGRVWHPEPVNLAFGTNTTLNELIATMETLSGRAAVRDHLAPRSGDVSHSQADSTQLRALFPTVQPVPLDQGIRETLDWFEETR